jgi:hypothetical protein
MIAQAGRRAPSALCLSVTVLDRIRQKSSALSAGVLGGRATAGEGAMSGLAYPRRLCAFAALLHWLTRGGGRQLTCLILARDNMCHFGELAADFGYVNLSG